MKHSVCNIIKNSPIDALDIKLLISYVTGLNKVEIITKNDYQLTLTEYAKLNELVERRKNGEPLNYIIGYKEFYSRKFKVNRNTLIPRPETELLVEEVLRLAISIRNANVKSPILEQIKDPMRSDATLPTDRQGVLQQKWDLNMKEYILELGTGSGCIAITCKLEDPSLEVLACDKYSDTLTVAKENAHLLNADVKFILSDWFENITEKFDIIVSNPPYISEDDEHLEMLKYEPRSALTDNNDGLSCIKIIIKESKRFLKQGGYLIFEHGYMQGDVSRSLLEEENCYTSIKTIKDYAGLDRITVAQYN